MAVSAVTAVLGGTYHIFPKMTGKMYNETLGKLGFWLFFIGANITFSITIYMGAAYGMPRRYYDYAQFPEVEGLQQIATYGSYVILLGAIVVLISWIHALVAGEKAPLNPWDSKSLEWTHTASPPPIGNFAEPVKLSEDWDPYGIQEGLTRKSRRNQRLRPRLTGGEAVPPFFKGRSGGVSNHGRHNKLLAAFLNSGYARSLRSARSSGLFPPEW